MGPEYKHAGGGGVPRCRVILCKGAHMAMCHAMPCSASPESSCVARADAAAYIGAMSVHTYIHACIRWGFPGQICTDLHTWTHNTRKTLCTPT